MAAGVDRGKLELYLPASEAAIGQARAFVDRLTALDPHRDARFAVRLLVSELFTNAVKYGSRREGSRVRLLVAVTDSHVRVEIGDRGRGFAEGETTMPDAEAESGEGSRSSTRSRTGGASSATARRASGSSSTCRAAQPRAGSKRSFARFRLSRHAASDSRA